MPAMKSSRRDRSGMLAWPQDALSRSADVIALLLTARLVYARYLRRLVRGLRAFYALWYWRGHLRLARIMMQPGLAGFACRRPRVLFKYLHCRYLAAGLDSARRLAILTDHYTRLASAFPAPLLRTLLSTGWPVWQRQGPPLAAGISLSFPRHDFEGELMLAFLADDVPIYTMTVTLARGGIAGRDDACVLLVTNLQGGRHQLPLIRKATRACANTPPAYLLLAALEGLAAFFAAGRIAAVGNTRQLAKAGSGAATGEVRFDYDRFWSCLGGEPSPDGFYLFPPRLPEKTLQAFPSRHRSREARKRQFKRDVAQAVALCLRRAAAGIPPSVPGNLFSERGIDV